MSMNSNIQAKIEQALHPVHLQVEDESGQHNVPVGAESHFKVTVVAEAFKGQALLARHRQINAVLATELAEGGIHALAMHTMTPEEWFDKGGKVPESPPCLGGSAEADRSDHS